MSLLYFLTEVIHVHYLWSAGISFSLGMLFIYFFSIYWVFDYRFYEKKRIELPIFMIIGIIGLLINQLGLYIITEFYGMYYMVSKLLVTGLVFSWNYLARKNMLFVKKT